MNSPYFDYCLIGFEDGQVTWHEGQRYDLVYEDGSYVYTHDIIRNNYDYPIQEHIDLISFTISGKSYQAEPDMTWRDWMDSKYNTLGYSPLDVGGDGLIEVYNPREDSLVTEGNPVLTVDIIYEGHSYGEDPVSNWIW